ncbi:MAG: hypothetical protein ISR58_17405 [Anaerolineales bacterium]|nr:hypothetical protein [Chloroflexota bacterium]MBL6982954.1 hypothetical protein [Anaerolineales bacterium]
MKSLREKVRVAVGVPTETHPERHSQTVEQFLALVRFENRSKLAELPIELEGRVRDEFVN